MLEQISALEKSIEQRSQIEADLKSRINDISLKLVKLEEVRKRAESSAEYFKESATQSASDLLALKDVNEHLQKLLTDEEQKSLNLRHQLEELQRQIRRKNEDLAISQRKLAKFNAGITDMDSETELQYLKKRYRCTVCDERERSVIITRCYHLFCRECIETNIAKRNRKCPQCNKNFDKEDVHTFYL